MLLVFEGEAKGGVCSIAGMVLDVSSVKMTVPKVIWKDCWDSGKKNRLEEGYSMYDLA